MTNPKENEEINEELSIDELKSVSGGLNLSNRGGTISNTGRVPQPNVQQSSNPFTQSSNTSVELDVQVEFNDVGAWSTAGLCNDMTIDNL